MSFCAFFKNPACGFPCVHYTTYPFFRLREELAESRQLVETLRLEVHQKENIAKLAVDSSSQQVSKDDTAPKHTLIKKKRKFFLLIYEEIQMGLGCKVIYEEGLPNI